MKSIWVIAARLICYTAMIEIGVALHTEGRHDVSILWFVGAYAVARYLGKNHMTGEKNV